MSSCLPILRSCVAVLLVSALFAPKEGAAQSHFQDCFSMTGSTATLVVPASINPQINGDDIAAGDEIALLTSSGSCAGVGVWNGSNLSLTVWGDNLMTPEVDGFEADESFGFIAWDASEKTEADDVSVAYSFAQPYYRSEGTYAENAVYILTALSASSPKSDVPDQTSLVLPENGAEDVSTTPLLEWNQTPEATSFELQVALDDTFSDRVIDAIDLLETSYALPELEERTTYFWRVRAKNDAGSGPFSEAFTFTTESSQEVENRPPTFESSPAKQVQVGTEYIYLIITSDPDGDDVALSSVKLPNWTSFETTGAKGTLRGTPDESHVGAHEVVLQVTDAQGLVRSQSFTLTVLTVVIENQPPKVINHIEPTTLTVGSSGISIGLASVFADDDGDYLEYDVSVDVGGVVNASLQEDVLAVAPVASGDATVTIEATDPSGSSTSTSFKISVTQKAALSAKPDAISVREDESVEIAVLSNDTYSNEEALTISVRMKPSKGTAQVVGQTITYTPNPGYVGQDMFIYGISDGSGTSSAGTVYVTVVPAHFAPRFPSSDAFLQPADGASISLRRGESISIEWLPATDPENGEVSYSWQLSRVEDFSDLVLELEIGHVLEGSVDHVQIADALDTMGIDEGQEVLLYHRILATGEQGTSVGGVRSFYALMPSATSTDGETVESFTLGQNYPNPFNPTTAIAYALEKPGNVRLSVHNALGQEVRVLVDGVQPAGHFSVTLDGSELPSGVYIYRLTAGAHVAARTAILLK